MNFFILIILDLAKKRQSVIDRLQLLQDESKEVVDLFQNAEVVARLRQDKQFNLNFLKENYGVPPSSSSSVVSLSG